MASSAEAPSQSPQAEHSQSLGNVKDDARLTSQARRSDDSNLIDDLKAESERLYPTSRNAYSDDSRLIDDLKAESERLYPTSQATESDDSHLVSKLKDDSVAVNSESATPPDRNLSDKALYSLLVGISIFGVVYAIMFVLWAWWTYNGTICQVSYPWLMYLEAIPVGTNAAVSLQIANLVLGKGEIKLLKSPYTAWPKLICIFFAKFVLSVCINMTARVGMPGLFKRCCEPC